MKLSCIQKKMSKGAELLEIERACVAQSIAVDYMLKDVFVTTKFAVSNMLKTMFSLYSSELLVIDSGGKLPTYAKKRSLIDLVKRFLMPRVTNYFIIFYIYFEMLLLLFLLLGFLGFLYREFFVYRSVFIPLQMISFGMLFVVLSFACGFARLRLPIEILLLIGAAQFYCDCFRLFGWRCC